jgi:ABC-type spermidine/putrescine transport system permease subunit II/spermidine/putrescine-binding protein
MKLLSNFFKKINLVLILFFLYMPLLILIIYSFNGGSKFSYFKNFSLEAYKKLFKEGDLWISFSLTVFIAFISTFLAILISLLTIIGLNLKSTKLKGFFLLISNIPLLNADIATAVILMLFFFCFSFKFGILTLILSHLSFNLPYALIIFLPSLKSIPYEQIEASLDLGASPFYTIRKIVLPYLRNTIIIASAICFAMSFDDFIISYFNSGIENTISSYIYSLKIMKPYISAFSTLIIVISLLLIISFHFFKHWKIWYQKRKKMILEETFFYKRQLILKKKLEKIYQIYNSLVASGKDKNINLIKSFSSKIHLYKEKLNDYQVKIQKKRLILINQQIRREKKLKKSILNDHLIWRGYFRYTWKLLLFLILPVSLFLCFLRNSHYDLIIAGWDDYFPKDSFNQLKADFEGKKIRIIEVDSNEILVARNNFSKFDFMIPSEYIIKNYLEDKSEENNILKKIPFSSSSIDQTFDSFDYRKDLIEGLKNRLEGYVKNKNFLDYAIPYFYGDLIMIKNEKLNKGIYQNKWESWKKLGDLIIERPELRLRINDDPLNIFMIGIKATTSKTILNDWDKIEENDIDKAFDWLRKLIKRKNTWLESNETMNSTLLNEDFDFAITYNSDLIRTYKTWEEDKSRDFNKLDFEYQRDKEKGSNIWIDALVINKFAYDSNKENIDKILKYFLKKDFIFGLSNNAYYSSPYKKEEQVRDWKKWSKEVKKKLENLDNIFAIENKDYYNNSFTYTNQNKEYIFSKFNKLIN